jgi:hypothetical protein
MATKKSKTHLKKGKKLEATKPLKASSGPNLHSGSSTGTHMPIVKLTS